MTENFPQINVRQKTTDPGNSECIKQDECPPPPTPQATSKHIFFELQQINLEGKKKNQLCCRGTSDFSETRQSRIE